jgi:hypothetical protein
MFDQSERALVAELPAQSLRRDHQWDRQERHEHHYGVRFGRHGNDRPATCGLIEKFTA